MKLLRFRSTELLAPHDSASTTGSGLMAVLSGADCGAKSDGKRPSELEDRVDEKAKC